MDKRSNGQWVRELRGEAGAEAQQDAHHALAGYLYVVVFNYLRARQGQVTALVCFGVEELAALAQDFVQDTLERLARERFALLQQYREAGSFTGWAAQIARSIAAQELRKAYWQRRAPLGEGDGGSDDGEGKFTPELPDLARDRDPAGSAQLDQARRLLADCLMGLSERYRSVAYNCLAEGVAADAVARHLDTTPNAIYLIIQRAKRQLRQCLEGAGVDKTLLAVFA